MLLVFWSPGGTPFFGDGSTVGGDSIARVSSANVSSVGSAFVVSSVLTKGATAIQISWPNYAGAAQYSLSYGSSTAYGVTVNGVSSPYTVYGLTPGIKYHFKITAVTGVSSVASSVSTPDVTGMTSSTYTPLVSLYSYVDGETLGYQLVRLYGHSNSMSSGTVLVKNLANSATSSWPIYNSDYKAYVRLVPGVNPIQFNFNGTLQYISLNYQPTPSSTKKVKLFFFLGSNGAGTIDAPPGVVNSMSAAIQRIQTDGLMLQTFMAESLKASREFQGGLSSLPKSSFQLDLDMNQNPIVSIVRSTQTQQALWNRNDGGQDLNDARAILASQSSNRFSDSLFLGYSGISHLDPITHLYHSGVAIGGGGPEPFGYAMGSTGQGAGMIHSANLIFHPSSISQISSVFSDATPIDPTYNQDDSAGRGNRWGAFATVLGGWMHEGGHGFGLYHPDASPLNASDPFGIMYLDFAAINRFFMVYEMSSPTQKTAVTRTMGELGPSGRGWWHPTSVLSLVNSVFISPLGSLGVFDLQLPTIQGFAGSSGQVSLSWTPSRSATHYAVYYGTSSGSYPTLFAGGIVGTQTVVTGLTPGMTYYFRVRAVSGNDYQNSSRQVQATLPVAPTSVSANSMSSTGTLSGVTVTWAVPTKTVVSVYRSASGSSGNSYTAIMGCQGITTSSCTDTTAVPGVTYSYSVLVFGAQGSGSQGVVSMSSSPVIVNPPVVMPSPSASPSPVAVSIIPQPKSLTLNGGVLTLLQSTRIVVTDPSLNPLALVLQGDLVKLTGILHTIASGNSNPNDLVLGLNSSLNSSGRYFSHSMSVTDRVTITGSDYASAAQGTATLLQLIQNNQVPKLSLSDYSLAQYPGMMEDAARQKNTVQDLKSLVDLARYYKVRYLHLHLNDDQGFTFQSTVLPNLGVGSTGSGNTPLRLTRAQLTDLLQYADNRGVSIIPELETVAHTSTLVGDYPAIFGGVSGLLNLVNETTYTQGLIPLITEMCGVFASSPFFHVGGDEAQLSNLTAAPTYANYLSAHRLNNVNDVYTFHMGRLNDLIKNTCHKKTIAWEPTGVSDIITMEWHIGYSGPDRHGPVGTYLSQGLAAIQEPWTPSVYTSVYSNWFWSPFDSETPVGSLNLGSEAVLWELPGSIAVPYLRYKVPARQDSTYGYGSPARNYGAFAGALSVTDSKLDTLLNGFEVQESGVVANVSSWLKAQQSPQSSLTVTPIFGYQSTSSPSLKFLTRQPNSVIRYTTDGTLPTLTSTAATGAAISISQTLNSQANSTGMTFNAALFDQRTGSQLGGVWTRTYLWQPFTLNITDVNPASTAQTNLNTNYIFPAGSNSQAHVQLAAAEGTGVVRYSVCGPLLNTSPSLQMGQSLSVLGSTPSLTVGFFVGSETSPRSSSVLSLGQAYDGTSCMGLQVGNSSTGVRLFTSAECSTLGGSFYQNGQGWQTRNNGQYASYISSAQAAIYGECLQPNVGSFSASLASLNDRCPGQSTYVVPNQCVVR